MTSRINLPDPSRQGVFEAVSASRFDARLMLFLRPHGMLNLIDLDPS
jgi:hypothetical protein